MPLNKETENTINNSISTAKNYIYIKLNFKIFFCRKQCKRFWIIFNYVTVFHLRRSQYQL